MHIRLVTLAAGSFWAQESLLLVRSLRLWGGEYADLPVSILTLAHNPPLPKIAAKLEEQNVRLKEITLDESALKFPLAVVPFGAAAAEQLHQDADLLAWLLPDTLVLNPPVDFLLAEHQQLACRPVHHQNIGSPWGQTLDPFWQKIYEHCAVPEAHVFEMTTCCQERVRPYFNAGLLVTRPHNGLFQAWLEAFLSAYRDPDFTPFFEQQKYAVYLHQAVLAGVILNRYPQATLAELPESYNYPLHMHAGYPSGNKPERLSVLVTARYERIADLPALLQPFEDTAQISVLL